MNLQHQSQSHPQVNTASFDADVLRSNLPVLVMFWTQWSSPCRVLEPVLAEIASCYSDELKVAWVDADENPELAFWYGIQAVPTLLYFGDGTIRSRIVGTANKRTILSKLNLASPRDSETERFPDAKFI